MKKINKYLLIGTAVLASIFTGYRKVPQKVYKMVGAEIFDKKSLKHKLGVPFYTAEELGDLKDKEFQTTITASGKWANNLNYSSWIKAALSSLRNPTHIIYFSQTRDGLYRFYVKPF